MAELRGRFITVEGGEGAGKSTQVSLLVAALARAGLPVRATREPGGSPGGEAIRRLLLEGEGERWDAISEALLLVAARHDHVTRLIKPSLEQGVWVVSDRFADSTLAYQGYGRGVGPAQLAELHHFALGAFAPDLTLVLDLPIEIGLARAAARSAAERAAARASPVSTGRSRITVRSGAKSPRARRCNVARSSNATPLP